MTEPPRDDSSPTGSAPWERPRRWNQQRLDATRVDDLLARLGNEDESGGRRSRRREAERAAREAAAARSAGTDATESTDATADTTSTVAPVAAGDIAAHGGRAADADPSAQTAAVAEPVREPQNDPVTSDGPAVAEPAAAEHSPTAVNTPVPTDVSDGVPETPPAEGAAAEPPAEPAAAPTAEQEAAPTVEQDAAPAADPASGAAPDPAELARCQHGGPGVVTAPGMDDHVTDLLPTIGDEDIASIRAALSSLQNGGPGDAGAGHGSPIVPVAGPRAVGAPGPADQADPGPTDPGGPPSPPSSTATGGSDDPGDDPHRRKGFLAAGRVAVSAVAVVLLLFTGNEWTTLGNTQEGLDRNSGSYLATTDAAISKTTRTRTPATTATGAEEEAPLPLYPPENILLLGSDSRADGNGDNGNSDGSTEGSANSDTMMVAHVSADRQHIAIVSFPRFLQIKAPSCQGWDYTTRRQSGSLYPVTKSSRWRISNAYAVGGPACSVLAVQGVTGLQIDRVIDIDFTGFKTMVEALNGVEVNICKPIVDAELQTVVAQGGVQMLSGDQALSVVRARKVIGDPTGTDGRMRRQQVVLSAMLRQVTSAGTLLSPGKLSSFLEAFVGSTHTDNVSVESLIMLAKQLGNLDPGRVTFYSVPHSQSTTAADTEILDPSADELFAALRDDSLLPGETVAPPTPSAPASSGATSTPRSASKSGSSTKSSSKAPASSSASRSSAAPTTSSPAPPPAPQTLTVDPAAVDLQIINLTGQGGVATSTMNSLNELGFDVTGDDLLLPEGETADGITVEYSPDNRDAAVTVAAAVPGAELVEVADLGERVRLLLGASFDGTVTGVAVGEDVPSRFRTTPATTEPAGSSESGRSTEQSAPADGGGAPRAGAPSTSAANSTPPTSTQSTSTLSTEELGAINAGDSSCA